MKVLTIATIVAILLFSLILIIKNGANTPTIFSRRVRNDDLTIRAVMDIKNLEVRYDITPHKDIYDLEVEINFLDQNQNNLTTLTRKVGDLKAEEPIVLSISLFDLGWNIIWKMEYEKLLVTSGRVPLFT